MPFEITKDDQKYIFYIHILDKSYSIEISFIGLEELDFDNEKLAAIEKLFKTIGEALSVLPAFLFMTLFHLKARQCMKF
jgi:hypothetical protein